MPVMYSGLVEEHVNTRQQAGLFDVSHMGEIFVSGDKALSFLDLVTCNDVKRLNVGQAQYSLILNERGGVVDDIIVYRLEEKRYLLCVNASNVEKDYEWLISKNSTGAQIENLSSQYAQIAIQGPKAVIIAAAALDLPEAEFAIANFPSFSVSTKYSSRPGLEKAPLLFARTGYTGEDGFEIFCPADRAAALWETLIEFGSSMGLKATGLGARDTLRLEACLPLYGHELRDNITVLESGMGWAVKLNKGEFIGREALVAAKEQGLAQKLVGLEVLEPGIIREGALIFNADGKELGFVTSGTKPPTVAKAIALAFVPSGAAALGSEFFAEVRGKRLKTCVIKTPFFRRNY